MVNGSEREPGECSPSPPEHRATATSSTRYRSRRENRPAMWKSDSVVELVDLDFAVDEDDDIEVLSDEQEAADADDFVVDVDEDDDGNDEFFVLDTNRAEIIEEEKITIVDCKGSEQIQLSKAKRSEETFDITKILTNDPTTASLSAEKKENLKHLPKKPVLVATKTAGDYAKNASLHGHPVRWPIIFFRPGYVSDSLRDALGIGKHDIPEWIYRMRQKGFVEGYPPGYLDQVTQFQNFLPKLILLLLHLSVVLLKNSP
ncbi:unnamed protein product [Gongylonema pulchrum]|uniref:PSP domain-containing protein n=1 Tax=Gongylonema pulchrum TaxID=637853 RepID=A0A183E7A7_9BILA|nr:unnamed protein product [Gongylonema pulchrum]